MAHTHDESDSNYFMEQVCTIAICGLFGVVGILLYYNKPMIGMMLNPNFHWTLLAGGIVLVALAAVRALAVWVAVGRQPAHVHVHHDHDHDHGTCDHDHHHEHGHDHCHEHGHDHHHHEHDHAHAAAHDHGTGHDDHGHDHGFGPWRYVVLLLPLVLFFLGMPNEGFAVSGGPDLTGFEAGGGKAVADKGFAPELGFKELEGAAYTPERREAYEGKMVKLKGQLAPSGNPKMFSLVRYQMRCCAADAVRLNAVIIIDPSSPEKIEESRYSGQWVEVTGQVQFREYEHNGQKEWKTIIFVQPDANDPEKALNKLIRILPPDERPGQFI
jgi:hypothetical protein